MTLKIRKAADIKMEHLSWLFYGAAGSGKTTLAATFPSPIAMINMVTANEAVTVHGHPGVDVLDVESPADMNDALAYVINNTGKFKTVLVDNMTAFIEMIIRSKKGRMSLEEWMPIGLDVMNMIDRLRKLPAEIVYTAALGGVKDEVSSGLKHGGPVMFNWLEQRFPSKMDAIVYLESSSDARGIPTFRAYLSGFGPMIGRVRGSLPGGMIESPSYAKLIEKLSEPLFQGSGAPSQALVAANSDTAAILAAAGATTEKR